MAWYQIAGNWLGGGAGGNSGCVYNSTSNYAPYTTAPTTAHIMWTKPYAPGGLIGGEFGGNQVSSNFYATSQYERKFAGIIINGVLYCTLEPGATNKLHGLGSNRSANWKNNMVSKSVCNNMAKDGSSNGLCVNQPIRRTRILMGQSTNSSTKHRQVLMACMTQ